MEEKGFARSGLNPFVFPAEEVKCLIFQINKVRSKLTALLHSKDNMPSRQHFLAHHPVLGNNSDEYQPH